MYCLGGGETNTCNTKRLPTYVINRKFQAAWIHIFIKKKNLIAISFVVFVGF